MKKEGHPGYFVTKVHCSCGAEFVTRSTKKELRVDICGACHPFYTGTQKILDTAGRIETFTKKFGSGAYASLAKKKKKAEPTAPAAE
jgi:large subunit ribosomal protein L31